MVNPEELEIAYSQLAEYHDLLPHPEILTKGEKTLVDGTQISTTKIEPDLDVFALSVDVSYKEEQISFSVTPEGLQSCTLGRETATLESSLSPDYDKRRRISYLGIDVDGTEEERFRGGARFLVSWLQKVNDQGFMLPPVVINRPVNTFTAARRFERFMREVNPNFDVNDHI